MRLNASTIRFWFIDQVFIQQQIWMIWMFLVFTILQTWSTTKIKDIYRCVDTLDSFICFSFHFDTFSGFLFYHRSISSPIQFPLFITFPADGVDFCINSWVPGQEREMKKINHQWKKGDFLYIICNHSTLLPYNFSWCMIVLSLEINGETQV